MVHFNSIRKTLHYKIYHEKQFPWSKVIEIILSSSKKIRRKGNKLEIETEKYYILCKLENKILWIINAKHKK